MRFTVSTLLTALLSFAAGMYLPWYSIALVSFLVALCLYQKPVMAYVSGFTALFVLWGLLAWWIDAQNGSILSKRIAMLFSLGSSSFLLILITALVGALIGGLAALSGSFLRNYLQPYWPVDAA